jgi:hypothetical protein
MHLFFKNNEIMIHSNDILNAGVMFYCCISYPYQSEVHHSVNFETTQNTN